MAGFNRAKRVSDPLDDKVRARLVQTQLSYVSSGSDHSSDDSPCLSELVHGFLENDSDSELRSEVDSERVDSASDVPEVTEDFVRLTAGDNAVDSYRTLLVGHVSEAAEKFSCLRSNRNVFRRNVMAFLRELGYNAAICKTKWDYSGGLTAGNYEFIDVLQLVSSTWHPTRYLVDLDFSAQFEIARPTERYSTLLRSLPRIFVGRNEELKKVVRVMCDVAKKSLRSKELSVPPWRKNRYMQNKWFGPYRRTTNIVLENAVPPVTLPVSGAKCKLLGFDDAVRQCQPPWLLRPHQMMRTP